MAKDRKTSAWFAELKRRASGILSNSSDQTLEAAGQDLDSLIHEIETQQIELELQNEDLRQAQEELNNSRQRFSDLYDFAPLGYLSISDKGLIREANLTAVDLLGVERSRLCKQAFSSYIHPDDQDIYYRHRKRLLAAQKLQSCELRLRKSDGTLFYGLLKLAINPAVDKHSSQFRIAMIDISQRKALERKVQQSRQEWEDTFAAIGDVITIQDRNMQVVMANKAAHEELQAEPGELVGRYCYELFRESSGPCSNCPGLTVLNSKQAQAATITHSERGKIFHVACFPLLDEQGCVRRIIHSARDITAQKKMEEQLLQSQKIESIGNLAGGVAHDFNNILTVISMHCEIAQEELEKGSDLWIDFEEIRKAGERAANLTRQLLGFSRRQMIMPKNVDVNNLITDLEKMLTRLVSEDISLETILDEEVGRIYADPGQLDQILINLVVNARDAVKNQPDATRKIITVSTSQVFLDSDFAATHEGSSPGWHLQLKVEDSGCGISQEVREHIFEPFYTTKAIGEGTGMGLATVYGIVKQNKGSIYVYSEPGEGAVFKVYWPIIKEEVVAEKEHKLQPAKGGSEVILLAEDNQPLRKITSRQLQSAGYTVIEADDGRKALEKAAQYQGDIDLLFTDVIMPIMGGKELGDKIRELYPETSILFASGYTDRHIDQDILSLGKNRFINKPYSRQDILSRIRQLLDDKGGRD